MTQPIRIALIILVPAALVSVLYMIGVSLPLPAFGRDYVVRIELDAVGKSSGLPGIEGAQDDSLPLVVIDAGHGGHDPGASGEGYQEKDLVLGLAKALRNELERRGGVRVALTREDDRFLLVEERYEIARRLGADLFVSVHADSAGDLAGVSGASIYTLSEEASSEAAARFAARENDADIVNGVRLKGSDPTVSSILVQLSQRRTSQESAEFAGLIEREGQDAIRFHPQARRSAALRVLRAPDVPSVLFEAGFVTNPADAERLASDEGKRRFAQAMARAIRIYFARQRNP